MFLVRTETVRHLFNAQKPELRGELRLDISSRRLPRDVRTPVDYEAAQEAVAERFLRLVLGLANDAVMKGRFRDRWDSSQDLPAREAGESLQILDSGCQLTSYVERLSRERFGLDDENRDAAAALESLAMDFHRWTCHPLTQGEASAMSFEVEGSTVCIKCPKIGAALPDDWPTQDRPPIERLTLPH